MYWAKEVLGEEVLDRALQKLLAQYAFKAAPYPNTRDFLAILRAEAVRARALITDLFEKITLFDLKASNARAARRADGRYDLTFDVDAHKAYADGAGRETAGADGRARSRLGAFTAEPGRRQFQSSDVPGAREAAHRIGALHVSLVVDRAPTWVGIDPYNKRIDRNSDDNLAKVGVEIAGAAPCDRSARLRRGWSVGPPARGAPQRLLR
jgi:hypothetical protein